jgi:hypothetical protein
MRRDRYRPPAQLRITGQQNEATRPDYLTRFKPGQCGNPRGRPKGRKARASLQDIVKDILFEEIEVRVGERTQKMPRVSALIRMAMNRALNGDHKFLTHVITLIRISGLSDIGGDAPIDADTSADEAIVADFIKRHGSVLESNSDPAKSETGTTEPNSREDGDDDPS